MRKYTLLYIVALMVTAIGAGACQDTRTYDHYVHTPLDGWERNDTLHFDVPPTRQGGPQRQWIGMRVYKDFPFRTITMIVDQTVLPHRQHLRDTISCHIMDQDGHLLGKRSLNFSEIRTYLREINLQKGDSIHIAVIHNMRRESIPGVADVGMEMRLLTNQVAAGVNTKENKQQ